MIRILGRESSSAADGREEEIFHKSIVGVILVKLCGDGLRAREIAGQREGHRSPVLCVTVFAEGECSFGGLSGRGSRAEQRLALGFVDFVARSGFFLICAFGCFGCALGEFASLLKLA